MEITEEQLEEAKRFTNYYIDLLDNHRDTFIFYLSDNATVDWFGQTIKGEKNINTFLRNTLASVKHDFSDPRPVSSIGYRDSHVIKYTKEIKQSFSPLTDPKTLGEITPPKILKPSSSHEEGQGDGIHNCEVGSSPKKRMKLELGDCIVQPPKIKYVSVEGHVQFHRKSSKKLQRETKWSRPCNLHVAYSGSDSTDFTIHLVIYQGNMRCRRNLLKEFEKVERAD